MDTVSRIATLVKTVRLLVQTYRSDIILAVGMLLLSLLSFAIGYLTAREQLQEPITIESEPHE